MTPAGLGFWATLWGLAGAPPAPYCVQVLDTSLRPLAGARVDVHAFDDAHGDEPERQTDRSGQYCFPRLPDPFELTVSAPGFVSERRDVGAGEALQPVLLERAARLHGEVTDFDGTPVLGASVVVTPQTGRPLTLESDAKGRFETASLPAGPLTVQVRFRRHESRPAIPAAALAVAEGGEVEWHPKFERGATLAGVVTTAKGAPLRYASVHIVDARAPETEGFTTSTDKQGRFTFSHLDAGPFRVDAAKGALKSQGQEVAAGGQPVRLTVLPAGRAQGKVGAPTTPH